MSTALLTPVNLANGRVESKNRWRKQILPFTTINYGGQKVTFDRKFMQDLISSFKARSHHQVPLQFADDRNTHTNDPERTRGYLQDLELAEDGLYGIFELGEKGAKAIAENADLGVSARILQGYQRRVDGKMFPAAMQHVLATVDPYVPGMKPWQQVDLANDDDTVTDTIDLSSEAVMPGKTKKDDEDQMVVVELSQSDYEAFQQMLSDQKAVMALANEEDDPENDDTDDPESDDTDDDGEDTPPADDAGTSTTETGSTDDDDDGDDDEGDTEDTDSGDREPAAAELSNAVDDVARNQVLELTNQLRASEVNREIDGLRRAGLAPAIINAARPGLEAPPAAIELSNGESTDHGQVLREVLHQVIELANSGHAAIDLDTEFGILTGPDPMDQRRKQALEAWENEQF